MNTICIICYISSIKSSSQSQASRYLTYARVPDAISTEFLFASVFHSLRRCRALSAAQTATTLRRALWRLPCRVMQAILRRGGIGYRRARQATRSLPSSRSSKAYKTNYLQCAMSQRFHMRRGQPQVETDNGRVNLKHLTRSLTRSWR